jgi:biopolymer transport protein ExbD
MYDFDSKPDLNITPLVDVMLVLLAILMVTTPVVEFEEKIQLPKGTTKQRVQEVSKIDIQITLDQEVIIESSSYKLKNFADSFILMAKDKSRDLPVYIRADKKLYYDDIIYVLKSVKEAGFLKVALVTDVE